MMPRMQRQDRDTSTGPSSPPSLPLMPIRLSSHSLVRFRQFPPEILSEIFVHCLSEKASFKPEEAPTLLTHVCRAWRTVALNTPRLWSTIVVPDWQSLPKGLTELFSLWVTRAGETPLDVDMGMFNEDVVVLPTSDNAQILFGLIRSMLEALAPHRQSVFRFKGVFPRELMRETKVEEMVNVEILSYCGMLGENQMMGLLEDAGDDSADMNEKLDFGPRHERLKTLVVCGCAVNMSSVMLQTQVTHIEILDLHTGSNLCQKQALDLITGLPFLKTCVLELSKLEPETWTGSEERIIFPNMELLFITWSFPADICQFLKSIATPNLDKLGLRGTPIVGRDLWSGLYDFLRASNAPLKRISIGDFAAVNCRYIDCLALCPKLEHLTINHTELSDEFFQRLSVTDGTAEVTLVPKLEIFNIGVCEGFSFESLKGFLEARSKTETDEVAKLKESAIMYCMALRERNVDEVNEIGLDNLIIEPIEDNASFPFARVIETHRDLIAMLFQNDEDGDENPPFAEFSDDEETLVGGDFHFDGEADEAGGEGEDEMYITWDVEDGN